MTTIASRAKVALNLKEYESPHPVERVGSLELECPHEKQMVLRMLIAEPFSKLYVPKPLEWVNEMIEMSLRNQVSMGVSQPFCYVTVRHGYIETEKDDEWHVDGFSMRITHLPEQNYVWSSNNPTEFVNKSFAFPNDFDPSIHNIHQYFDDNINEYDAIRTMKEKTVYCIDPYIVHRRPKLPNYIHRTFVRVSYTPIPIMDGSNTVNLSMSMRFQGFKRDGVIDFRDKLKRYEAKR